MLRQERFDSHGRRRPAIRVTRCAPELERRLGRIEIACDPPGFLVAAVVQLAMMRAAQRDGELVADLTTESSGLSEAEVMGVARLPPAHQAGLCGDIRQMIRIA